MTRFSKISFAIFFFVFLGWNPSVFSATALLRISSTPSGARVIVNDIDQGRITPATLTNLEAGKKYKIRLTKKGYEEYQTNVKLEVGSNRIHGDLEKLEKISKKSEPKKETKAVTDESDGTATQRAFGYNKIYKEGTYGWLEVSSVPQGAVVYLNDQRQVGLTPNKYKVPIGNYKVSVVIRGKSAREFPGVKINAGHVTTLETVDFRDEITRPNTRDLLK